MAQHDATTTRPVRAGATAVGPFTARWTEAGPGEGPIVLLLHGIYAGASSYEWRRLAPLLARTHRVRSVDLPGAGASDRPDLAWSAERLTWAVGELIDGAAEAGERPTVVASSLTGAHAVRAVTEGHDVERLLLITPTGLGTALTSAAPGWAGTAYALGRHTPLGDLLVAGLSSGPSVRWFQRNQTYRDPDVLTDDEVVEARRVARLPNAKHLQLAFVTNQLALALDEDEVRSIAPAVLWGSGQRFASPADAERWRAAGAAVTMVDDGLPQVESPEATAAWVVAP